VSSKAIYFIYPNRTHANIDSCRILRYLEKKDRQVENHNVAPNSANVTNTQQKLAVKDWKTENVHDRVSSHHHLHQFHHPCKSETSIRIHQKIHDTLQSGERSVGTRRCLPSKHSSSGSNLQTGRLLQFIDSSVVFCRGDTCGSVIILITCQN
jgi:hypothetical protein